MKQSCGLRLDSPEPQVESQGRRIVVPRCAKLSDAAFFSFADLCDRPLGAADYLAVGHAFHTVFVADIPRLTMQERDQVRRFITLIDTLYETHTKLVCTAELDPIPLFYVSEEERKTSVADEIFAWDRTVSRLMDAQVIYKKKINRPTAHRERERETERRCWPFLVRYL
ncbi:unnamed protein product [Durusdinium trenchii]|uniref:AFG1-like ATPase n=1 Tax=Durusdinium trenchii TaxID=1381693 RepID=A0ABP0I1S5_9DINO